MARRPSMDYVLDLRVQHLSPPIVRRLQVPGRTSLRRLHRAMQVVFGWLDYHLYEWHVGGLRYGNPELLEPEWEDEEVVLDDAAARLEKVLAPGMRVLYQYDFGDGWEVAVEVVECVPPRAPLDPVCLSGQRAGPKEDCGGVTGYEELVEALADPRHPDHRDMRRWAGRAYDPERFDLAAANRKLARLFPARAAAESRTPAPWSPGSGTPPLEAYRLDRLNLRQQMAAALRERGRPMSLEEIAERLERAGTRLAAGLESLRKAWRREGPFRHLPDGRLEEDPTHPDHWYLDYCLREALPKEPRAKPAPPPMPEGRVTREELALPTAHGIPWPTTMSWRRRLSLCLIARGGRAPLADLEQDLAGLGQADASLRGPVPGHRTELRLEGEELVLDPDGAEAAAACLAFRRWWAPHAARIAEEEAWRAWRLEGRGPSEVGL